ncbi:GIY-YIG nuclease family protein [Kaistella jeonii]|uniref:GIY-YIG nuclease family protein n=1 Tax=Kaistella jeonii TaxID=266749 RepID=UPI000690066E|nr:hypothetical protein [Kaistella jeonii]SFB71960.1 hypothetical protein SAMN05421876_101340 [Kaistella jeonii]VEI94930.1 Uncharacterised protein [Kaistella jeonii]
MEVEEIINNLAQGEVKLSEIKTYSKLPGIYALFFIGKKFPLENYKIPQNRIIYIGKTESSQQSRDANTHFKSGKTGSSTVRKSVGALLSQTEQITPLIRSVSDIIAERKSHFKFDNESEEKVTKWMVDNLAVSFYEYPESKIEIDFMETQLIKKLKPVLNIDRKNIDNPHRTFISGLRKKLGLIAHADFIEENKILGMKKENTILSEQKVVQNSSVTKGKYVGIWTAYLSEIKKAIISDNSRSTIKLDKELFQQAGNRKDYSFKLEYTNGIVSNNNSGSAVARDLDNILTNNKIEVANKIFRLTKEFKLIIE